MRGTFSSPTTIVLVFRSIPGIGKRHTIAFYAIGDGRRIYNNNARLGGKKNDPRSVVVFRAFLTETNIRVRKHVVFTVRS